MLGWNYNIYRSIALRIFIWKNASEGVGFKQQVDKEILVILP